MSSPQFPGRVNPIVGRKRIAPMFSTMKKTIGIEESITLPSVNMIGMNRNQPSRRSSLKAKTLRYSEENNPLIKRKFPKGKYFVLRKI